MSSSTYSIFVPIHNLSISDDIGGELRIEDVLFVSSKKIPRIRKRLGLPSTVSHYSFDRSRGTHYFFKASDVYAVIKCRGTELAAKTKAFKKIKDAVFLLASSQFNRTKRYNKVFFGSPEFSKDINDEVVIFDNLKHYSSHSSGTFSPLRPYVINKEWSRFVSRHFFPDLLKILNGKKSVNNVWKRDLRKAALLAGQSFFSHKLWESFLYNWIAIETLLTRKREKKARDVIVDRLVFLFGWLIDERYDPWEKIIKPLYKLRCNFVHEGIIEDITIKDVLETDMLLGNLLNNLCSLTSKIKGKNVLIELSERNKARTFLGYKQLKRPKIIRFTTPDLSYKEIVKHKVPRHWSM